MDLWQSHDIARLDKMIYWLKICFSTFKQINYLMKKLFIPFFILCGIISCDNSTIKIDASLDKPTKQESGSDDAVNTSKDLDTLRAMPDDLIGRVNNTLDVPYVLDHKKIENLDQSDNKLTQHEVTLLTEHLVLHNDFRYFKYRIESYFQFHHLKDSIGEDAYMEDIDLGMTQNCDAYVNKKVNLTENTSLLIWSLDYSTYEACPFYAGTYVLATMCVDGKISHTAFIGESSEGGDAPVWSSTEIFSSITYEGIDVTCVEETGGMDDEMDIPAEISKNNFRYRFTSNGIELEK